MSKLYTPYPQVRVNRQFRSEPTAWSSDSIAALSMCSRLNRPGAIQGAAHESLATTHASGCMLHAHLECTYLNFQRVNAQQMLQQQAHGEQI